MLLKAPGVRLDAKTKKGVTALIYAASEGEHECVALLLEAGADRAAKTSNNRDARENTELKMEKAGAERKLHFAKVLALLKGKPTSRPAAPLGPAAPGLAALAASAAKPLSTLGGGAANPFTLPGVTVASPAAANKPVCAATKPPACGSGSSSGAFHPFPTAPAAAMPGHPFGGAPVAASTVPSPSFPTSSQPVGGALVPAGPKGQQQRTGKPPATAQQSHAKPHVALSVDLEAILANVSSWSATGELGGAFRGLFDSRLQRVAELNEVVKECAAKLQRCGTAAGTSVGHSPPDMTANENELDAMQSTKEGINAKLEQLEGQERSLLQFVELLQRHEPGPDSLVDGLAVAPILLGELDQFQGAAEQLEQGVLRLERHLASLQANHWSKLTDKLSQHSDLVYQQALRVAALRDAAAAAHGRAHASATAASEDALMHASVVAHASLRADHDAPCLAVLCDQLHKRDARGIEPGAVIAVEEAARVGAPAAEPPLTSAPAAVPGGKRCMVATLASGSPSSATTTSTATATSTAPAPAAAGVFSTATSGSQLQTSAASKSGVPTAAKPSFETLFASPKVTSVPSTALSGAANSASLANSTLGNPTFPAAGDLAAAAPPADPASLPFASSSVVPTPADSTKLASLFSAVSASPPPKPGHAPAGKPPAPATPGSLASAAFTGKLSPSPAAKPPSRQPSTVAAGKATDVFYATLMLDNECPDEHRLTWYTRHKPANSVPAVLRDGVSASAEPSSATQLYPTAATSPPPSQQQNPFVPPSAATTATTAPAPVPTSFGE